MKNRDMKISDRKLRGEWAEMYFMARAAGHGLPINKPFGEMAHFDFVIGHSGCLLRVQVKSTQCKQGKRYSCSVRGGHRPYVGDPFDFVAALVIPEDIWYIIPAQVIHGRGSIQLHPESETSEFSPYKEAWQLLRTRPCAFRGTVDCIQACAESPASPREMHSHWAHASE